MVNERYFFLAFTMHSLRGSCTKIPLIHQKLLPKDSNYGRETRDSTLLALNEYGFGLGPSPSLGIPGPSVCLARSMNEIAGQIPTYFHFGGLHMRRPQDIDPSPPPLCPPNSCTFFHNFGVHFTLQPPAPLAFCVNVIHGIASCFALPLLCLSSQQQQPRAGKWCA